MSSEEPQRHNVRQRRYSSASSAASKRYFGVIARRFSPFAAFQRGIRARRVYGE
jgi:hypothetical protein